jgi:hypothetical protein
MHKVTETVLSRAHVPTPIILATSHLPHSNLMIFPYPAIDDGCIPNAIKQGKADE